jgi:hypothetical protein
VCRARGRAITEAGNSKAIVDLGTGLAATNAPAFADCTGSGCVNNGK